MQEELGGFVIQDLLGEGGMGMVYRARDERLDRDVAIKVLHPALVASSEGRARFRAEAKAVGRLTHPNIVQVFQWSDEGDDRQFLVMEYLEGLTLGSLMDRVHFSPPESLLCVAIPLTKALLHAHNHQVVHRDIKPGNVMVGVDGSVKLMDFGIARLDDANGLTITGALVGSPAHMAPEVINGERADERSDQFSLGTVLYEMAAGVSPFDAPNPAAIFRKVDLGEYTPLSRAAPALNSSLAEAIEQLMARYPTDRYSSLQEFLDRIELVAPNWLGSPQRAAQLLMQNPQVTTAAWRGLQVKRLSDAAEDAIRHRSWPEAVALANRVVALDPEQTELLHRVSGAAHRPWLRPAVGAALLLTIGLTLTSQWMATGPAPEPPAAPKAIKPKAKRFRRRVIAAPSAVPRAEAGPEAEERVDRPVVKRSFPVTVQVFPWAELWVNGKKVGAGATKHALNLPRGRHKIELRHDLADPVVRELRLPGSEPGGGINLTTRIRRFRPASVLVTAPAAGKVTVLGQQFAVQPGDNTLSVRLTDARFREGATLRYEAADCSRRLDMQLEAAGRHRWQVDCSLP